MNDINGYTITGTTNEHSRVYMHTFSFPTSLEQTTVKVESKKEVPKLKGILKKHNTIVPTVSPFDPWCDGIPVDNII
jgi:translation elongation factor EF-G